MTHGFTPSTDCKPLMPSFEDVKPEVLGRVIQTIRSASLDDLEIKYNRAIRSKERLTIFLVGRELAVRGIPPAFRHVGTMIAPLVSMPKHDINTRLDLWTQDIIWLALHHPPPKAIRNRRIARDLFEIPTWPGDVLPGVNLSATFDEMLSGMPALQTPRRFLFNVPTWLKDVEYRFMEMASGGTKFDSLCKALQLKEPTQWECTYLREKHVRAKAENLSEWRQAVYDATMNHRFKTGPGAMTRTMSEAEAKEVLYRRYGLWVCAMMSRDGTELSPARAARLYERIRGETTHRNIAARAISWMQENVPETRFGRNKPRSADRPS